MPKSKISNFVQSIIFLLISFFSLFLTNSAFASKLELDQAKAKLVSLGIGSPTLLLDNDQYYLFQTDRGIMYLSVDGQYLIQGRITKVNDLGKLVDLTTEFVMKQLAENKSKAITYKAVNEKYTVTVFSDYTCHYCKILHNNIEEYNKAGITISEIPFPRAGLTSDVAKRMAYIFAQSPTQRSKLMLEAFNGNFANIKLSESTFDVEMFYTLGELIGLRGTPTMVLTSGKNKGMIIPGYLSPQQLIEELNNKN